MTLSKLLDSLPSLVVLTSTPFTFILSSHEATRADMQPGNLLNATYKILALKLKKLLTLPL